MGFYFELEPAAINCYQEMRTPTIFWGLYGLCGFALMCMGLAAYSILGTIYRNGSTIDVALVASFIAVISVYVLIGARLVGIRKYVIFEDALRIGFKFFNYCVTQTAIPKSDIAQFEIRHSSPSSNVAPSLHQNRQYFMQGHYLLLAKLRSGRTIVLDRSVEAEALLSLKSDLSASLK